MLLLERVARALCIEAANCGGDRVYCLFCKDEPDCTLWETFQGEAKAAVMVVRKSDRGK